jgi:hypothetical protein
MACNLFRIRQARPVTYLTLQLMEIRKYPLTDKYKEILTELNIVDYVCREIDVLTFFFGRLIARKLLVIRLYHSTVQSATCFGILSYLQREFRCVGNSLKMAKDSRNM